VPSTQFPADQLAFASDVQVFPTPAAAAAAMRVENAAIGSEDCDL